jgi:hypothetical protein
MTQQAFLDRETRSSGRERTARSTSAGPLADKSTCIQAAATPSIARDATRSNPPAAPGPTQPAFDRARQAEVGRATRDGVVLGASAPRAQVAERCRADPVGLVLLGHHSLLTEQFPTQDRVTTLSRFLLGRPRPGDPRPGGPRAVCRHVRSRTGRRLVEPSGPGVRILGIGNRGHAADPVRDGRRLAAGQRARAPAGDEQLLGRPRSRREHHRLPAPGPDPPHPGRFPASTSPSTGRRSLRSSYADTRTRSCGRPRPPPGYRCSPPPGRASSGGQAYTITSGSSGLTIG